MKKNYEKKIFISTKKIIKKKMKKVQKNINKKIIKKNYK